jgi:hypothetical protein
MKASTIATILIVRGRIIREVYDSRVTTSRRAFKLGHYPARGSPLSRGSVVFVKLSQSHRGFSPVSKQILTPGTVLTVSFTQSKRHLQTVKTVRIVEEDASTGLKAAV